MTVAATAGHARRQSGCWGDTAKSIDSSRGTLASAAWCFKMNSAPAMSASRSRRSFVRQLVRSVRTGFPTSAGSALQSGSLLSTVASVSLTVVALECALPRQHFEEHAAERPHVAALVGRRAPSPARALIYAAVPRIIPTCVIAGVVIVGDSDRRLRPDIDR